MPQEFLTYFVILSVVLLALVIILVGVLIFIALRISQMLKKFEIILGSGFIISKLLRRDLSNRLDILKWIGRKIGGR